MNKAYLVMFPKGRSHYSRWKRHGDASTETPLRRAKGEGTINKGGYRLHTRDGVAVYEHHLVMEKMIGRQLLPGENVHHKNGVRDDNRPENLELWTRVQPPGKRVEDLLEWAKSLIRQYEPTWRPDGQT